jgi:hypothetical protein
MPNISDIRIASNDGALSVTPTTIDIPAYPASYSNSATIAKESTLLSVNGISLGKGAPIYVGSTGSENKILQFRSLIQGPGITLTQPDGETIVISSSNAVNVDLSTATGILPITKGGTGNSTNVYNGLMIGGANTTKYFPPPLTTKMLIWDSISNNHAWSDIPSQQAIPVQKSIISSDNIVKVSFPTTTDIALSITQQNIGLNNLSGILSIAKGGTGTNSFTNNSILLGGTSTINELLPATGFLKYDSTTGKYSWGNAGGISSITIASTSSDFIITNPTITSVGVIGLSLTDTGIIPGTYSNAAITVDSKGRITTIVSGNSTSTIGSNLGAVGEGIYSGNNTNTMLFKRIMVDSNLSITSQPETLNIGVGMISVAKGGTGLSTLGTTGQSIRVNATRTGYEYYTPTNAGGSVTSVGLSTSNNKLSVAANPITTAGNLLIDINESNLVLSNMSGILPTDKGGTGLTTMLNNSVLVGTSSGFRLLPPPVGNSTLNFNNGNIEWGTAGQSATIPSNLVMSYTFTMNYNQSALVPSTINDLPNGWSYIISGQDVIINHTVGQPPLFLTLMGLDTSASPNVFKVMYPTSTSPMSIPEQTTGGKELSLTQFKFRATTSATGATTGSGPSIAKVRITF